MFISSPPSLLIILALSCLAAYHLSIGYANALPVVDVAFAVQVPDFATSTPQLDTFVSNSAIDSEGNVYVSGNLNAFGPIGSNISYTVPNLTTIVIEREGGEVTYVGYIIKYNPQGQAQWFIRFDSLTTIFDQFPSIDLRNVQVSEDNFLFVVGTVKGGLSLNSNVTSVNPGNDERIRSVFVAKLTLGGDLIWARQFEYSELEDNISNTQVAMDIDAEGSLYITTTFFLNLTVGGVPITTNGPPGIDLGGVFAKFDQDTNLIWLRFFNATNRDDVIHYMDANRDGYSCVSGVAFDSIDFGNGVILTGEPGRLLGYVVQFDKFGQALWATSFTTTSGNPIVFRVAIDSHRNCYVGGRFQDDLRVGSFVVDRRSDPPGRAVFVTKLNMSGTPLFLRASSRSDIEFNFIYNIYADDVGNFWTAGSFGIPGFSLESNLVDVNITETELVRDIVIRFSPAGDVVWAFNSTGAPIIARTLVVDRFGSVTYDSEFGRVGGPGTTMFGPFAVSTQSVNSLAHVKLTDSWGHCFGCASFDKCCPISSTRFQCYNPATHTCTAQFQLCPLNHLSCGVACYLPSRYSCCNGRLARLGSC